ncbi:odv-ec27 [Adoxophyes orana granulovirus]|uniref:Odv-ec27 n=1 Tax=Adoxophyes orana granulovirus TaxID=170617 RepID=Q7T9T3_GVAO|nr:odv-ec27 [Adoxophyes orana granulovirus]AAP85719.1 odv-ec27 [Adoxophyes orana granulovirus]AJA91722.1 ODV-EC27 [Adoxophyes orana granulovirus]
MNRSGTVKNSNNFRTVTEIVDSDDLYQKDFDVSNLEYVNDSFLRKISKRQLYLMVAKYYVEVVKELDLPDLKLLFSSNNMSDKIFSFVYYSLAFVNNQLIPHDSKFVDMKFVEIKDRKMVIPTEPIVFYKSLDSEDQTITCYVDTLGIARILEKPFDVNVKFDHDDNRKELFKLIDRIKVIEKINQPLLYQNKLLYRESEPNLNETYFTPIITLLILFSNAYMGLYKLIHSDFQQYFHFLLNYENLVKEQILPNVNNLITGHFSFRVQTETKKNSLGGLVFK